MCTPAQPWPSKRNPQRVPKPRRDRRKPHHCLLRPAGASRRNRALAATGAARALRIRNPEVLVPESLEDSGSPPYGVLGRRRGVEVLTVGLGRPRQRRAGSPGRFALPFTQVRDGTPPDPRLRHVRREHGCTCAKARWSIARACMRCSTACRRELDCSRLHRPTTSTYTRNTRTE